MQNRIKKRELHRMAARSHRGHTDLYRYLRANYAALVARGVGTDDGPSWSDVVAIVIRAGQRNRKGEPPSANSVRRIFATVKRDVREASAAREKRTGTVQGQSLFNAEARAKQRSSVVIAPPPAAPAWTTAETEADARAEANLARMRSTVAERAGKNQPKERTT